MKRKATEMTMVAEIPEMVSAKQALLMAINYKVTF
jgi:hypothetical protein